MSRQIIPQSEDLDQSADYARWEFEAMRAEWEGEQETFPDLTTLPRMFPHLTHHGRKRQPVRLAACRKCGYSENRVE